MGPVAEPPGTVVNGGNAAEVTPGEVVNGMVTDQTRAGSNVLPVGGVKEAGTVDMDGAAAGDVAAAVAAAEASTDGSREHRREHPQGDGHHG